MILFQDFCTQNGQRNLLKFKKLYDSIERIRVDLDRGFSRSLRKGHEEKKFLSFSSRYRRTFGNIFLKMQFFRDIMMSKLKWVNLYIPA